MQDFILLQGLALILATQCFSSYRTAGAKSLGAFKATTYGDIGSQAL